MFMDLLFDVPKSKYGFGAGCVLIDPKGSKIIISFRLEFECTNNIDDYEYLVKGLRKAVNSGAQAIECYGDSDIIIKKVRNNIHCISPHLMNYEKIVRDFTNYFKAFNIKSICRSQNYVVDLLDNMASRLIPPKGLSHVTFSIKLMFFPYILENVTS